MFARFDENPAMTLRVIKETKRYGRTDSRTDGRTDGQRENSIPPTNKVCGGYKSICLAYMNMFARFDENPAMAYNRISIKPYIKSHLELQREITQVELAPSPYFFV